MTLLFVLLAYGWTASSSGNPLNSITPFQFKYGQMDYYNLQADAFLHGQLNLRVPVDPVVLKATNPYDPTLSAARLPDASYFHGKYYLSWGPAPALLVFLPAQVLGIGQIRENAAIVMFSFLGAVFSLLLLRELLAVLVERPRRWFWPTAGATLCFGGVTLFLLRVPTVYEVAISAGFCFFMGGMLVLVREHFTVRPRRRMRALASVMAGLAAASRPTMAIPALIVFGCVAWQLLHRPDRKRARSMLVALLGPFVFIGVLLMLYNHARFGSFLDFGNKWQVGSRDVRHIAFNSLANVPTGLYAYLLAPPRLDVTFPFFHLPSPATYPITAPPGYLSEITSGIVSSFPVVLLSVLAVSKRRFVRPFAADARAILLSLVASAMALVFAASFAAPGVTERYEVDFMPILTVAALAAWATSIDRGAKRSRLIGAFGLATAGVSVIVGISISLTGYYDSLRTGSPDVYTHLERAFNFIPSVAARLSGRSFITDVSNIQGYEPASLGYIPLGLGGVSFAMGQLPTIVWIASARRQDLYLRATYARGPDLPTIDLAPVNVVSHGLTSVANLDLARPIKARIRLNAGLNEVLMQPALKGILPLNAPSRPLVLVKGLQVTH